MKFKAVEAHPGSWVVKVQWAPRERYKALADHNGPVYLTTQSQAEAITTLLKQTWMAATEKAQPREGEGR